MKHATTGESRRLSAEERREAILVAAIGEFATHGLDGASTEAIAAQVGISQPYIFKIFGTKKDLFIAAMNRVCDTTLAIFESGAQQNPADPLAGMGQAYRTLLSRRDELLMLLQSFAAGADPDIRPVARQRMQEIYEYIQRTANANDWEVQQFIGQGLYLTVSSSLGFAPSQDMSDLIGKRDHTA